MIDVIRPTVSSVGPCCIPTGMLSLNETIAYMKLLIPVQRVNIIVKGKVMIYQIRERLELIIDGRNVTGHKKSQSTMRALHIHPVTTMKGCSTNMIR